MGAVIRRLPAKTRRARPATTHGARAAARRRAT